MILDVFIALKRNVNYECDVNKFIIHINNAMIH